MVSSLTCRAHAPQLLGQLFLHCCKGKVYLELEHARGCEIGVNLQKSCELRYTGAKVSEIMLDEVFCNKERIKGVKVGTVARCCSWALYSDTAEKGSSDHAKLGKPGRHLTFLGIPIRKFLTYHRLLKIKSKTVDTLSIFKVFA